MRYREEAAALNVAGLLGVASAWPLLVLSRGDGVALVAALAFLGAALGGVGVAGFAAWRDPVLFCKHAFTATLFALGGCALALALAKPGRRPVAITAGVALAAAALVAVPRALARSRRGPPHVLLSSGADPVWELDGVQLAFAGEWAVVAGRNALLAVLLENCWSGPRQVRVELADEQRQGLQIVPRLEVELAAGEVRRVELSLGGAEGARGEYVVLLTVTVRGRRGRRVRHRRGREFVNRVTRSEQLAYAAAGAFVWGGGLRLRLLARPRGLLPEEAWRGEVRETRVWPPEEPGAPADGPSSRPATP